MNALRFAPFAVVPLLLWAKPIQAAGPDLFITPIITAGEHKTYEINTNTAGNEIAAVEAFVTFPVGTTYVSADTSLSHFTTEVTPAELKGGELHIVRLFNNKVGLVGPAVPFAKFTVNGNGVPAIDLSSSKMIRLSDSVDVLHPTIRSSNSSPNQIPSSTQPKRNLTVVVISLLFLALGALFIRIITVHNRSL